MSTSTAHPEHPDLRPGLRVAALDGLSGEVEQLPGDRAIVRLEDGRRLVVDTRHLRVEGGVARLDVGTSDVDAAAGRHEQVGEERVIPVLEERVHVGKERVETGRVRVAKRVVEERQTIQPELTRQEVDVRRVEVNRVLDAGEGTPEPRQEGDTLVIPVVEERVVVTKQLVLREELHVTRRTTTEARPQEVTVRREEVDVERLSGDDAGR